MQLITKIFLFILSSLCLFFLVFFTFIVPSMDSTINVNYEYTNTGTYLIEWESTNYKIIPIDKNSENSTWMKMYNISLWNNIFFTNGNIEQKWDNEIHLWEWTYYFDINSLDFNNYIHIEGARISSHGPWDYIVNVKNKIRNSIFSISSKIELNLYNPALTTEEGTLLDIYPNMYAMYDPQLNTQIINADLLRIQNVQDLGMINSPLYKESPDVSWNINYELHDEVKKYVFLENENNYNFIKKIFNFNKFQEKTYKTKFIKLTQNNFYNFPGEKYIIKYYTYFQNEEKKKVYYKNIILKELVSIINSKNNIDSKKIDIIIENITLLKENHPDDYKLIRKTINHYYENILYSQYSSPSLLVQFSKLNQKLNEENEEFNYISLLALRNIYTRYHNGNSSDFHKLLNGFIDQHKIEMNMSIYDENHRVHNYFLFFLKNILVADFSKVEDHNDIVLLFQKYLDIQNVFLEKWDDVTKKTALFDNATLLKVFVNITKLNFFEEKLDEKGLLIPLKPARITQSNYNILYNNLNQLLDFHKQYQYFIDNSDNRKDKILSLSYKKYSSDLKEYFLALNDYNQYILQYDTAAINPDFQDNKIEGLQKDDAVKYLEQFIWVSSFNTIIEVRDYGYCIQPIKENDIAVKNPKDWYCFKVENLIISWFNFKFILNTSDNNTISYLSYTDVEGNTIQIGTNYVMDHIQEDMLRKYASVQSKEKDKYDFSKFFINTFISKENFVKDPWDNNTIILNEFIPPNSSNDSLPVRKLKQALLGKNSYLEKIRSILPISYDYLIITRENNEYIVNVFPISFNITISNNVSTNIFKWKFSWIYSYWNEDAENIFENVSLLINDTKKVGDEFLLNKTPINIEGKFMTKDINTVLNKTLFSYKKIEDIYLKLYEKYPNQTITITYKLEQNKVDFNISNGYNYMYNMESQVEIYKNKNKLLSITYTKLKNYLDTLP